MYRDKVKEYLEKRQGDPITVIESEPVPAPDPISSSKVELKRKAAAFKAQGDILSQRAASSISHRRGAQLKREANVAYRLYEKYSEEAKAISGQSKDSMKHGIIKAEAKTKREEGVDWSAQYFLDVPDPEHPSTWGLRTHVMINGQKKMTVTQLGRAAAALGPKGFMGNQYKVKPNGKSKEELKKALVSKYRQLGVSDEDIPSYLLAAAHSADFDWLSEEVLAHYGRKGMKWGQRIFSKKGGGSKSISEKKALKKAKKLSDDELSTAIKRMKMEKEYASLSSTKKSKGQSAIKEVLASSTKSAAKKHTTKIMFDAMAYGIKKVKPSYEAKWK